MAVNYSCNGIVKEFPIPHGETFNSVTISFNDGNSFSYDKHSLLFMENIFTARGCVCFKEALPQGTIVSINSDNAETSEQAISRLDTETSANSLKIQQIVGVQVIKS